MLTAAGVLLVRYRLADNDSHGTQKTHFVAPDLKIHRKHLRMGVRTDESHSASYGRSGGIDSRAACSLREHSDRIAALKHMNGLQHNAGIGARAIHRVSAERFYARCKDGNAEQLFFCHIPRLLTPCCRTYDYRVYRRHMIGTHNIRSVGNARFVFSSFRKNKKYNARQPCKNKVRNGIKSAFHPAETSPHSVAIPRSRIIRMAASTLISGVKPELSSIIASSAG